MYNYNPNLPESSRGEANSGATRVKTTDLAANNDSLILDALKAMFQLAILAITMDK